MTSLKIFFFKNISIIILNVFNTPTNIGFQSII